jgi:hypothetical protein
MSFRIIGLPHETFAPLFGLSDAELATHGVERVRIDAANVAPCRITLDDAEPGESVLLMNFEHQPGDTPYRSRHAIYVRETTARTFDRIDEVPPALARRTLSVRAFDAGDRMIDAELIEGARLEDLLAPWLAKPETAYVQIHYAKRGCYAARAERL